MKRNKKEIMKTVDIIKQKVEKYKKGSIKESVNLKVISKNAKYSYLYALDILKGRFELGEKVISKDAHYSYYYARNVLKK